MRTTFSNKFETSNTQKSKHDTYTLHFDLTVLLTLLPR
jgi:heme/copper-type cytochrome/quinol oxidase subunit 4